MAAPNPKPPTRRAQPPKQRGWYFTIHEGHLLNNLTVATWDAWVRSVESWDGVRYLVFQQERGGNTARLHLQGYVHTTVAERASQLGTRFNCLPTAFQRARGKPHDNRAYCTKEDTREPGTEPYEYGDCPGGQGSRMAEVAASIKQVGLKKSIEKHPEAYLTVNRGMIELDRFYKRQRVEGRTSRPMEVIVVWGDAGSGKSHWANNWDPGNTFILADLNKRERLNLDGYDGQRTLLIEDFDGQIAYRTLLRMLDVYNVDFNTKGSMVAADWNYVLITSNINPCNWYPNDQDPWFYEENRVGPLQRRLTTVMRCEGIYPNSKVIHPDGTDSHFDDLPVLADIIAQQVPVNATVPAAGPDVPAQPQPVPATRSVPAAGTEEEMGPAGPEVNDLIDYDELEQMLHDAGVPPASLDLSDPEDEADRIIFGDDGDSDEPGGDWTHF